MTYVERARSMYERGDAPRAAFMFANGLIRDPDNDDALNWLLMLYVEKIEKPGMERDILRVLDIQRDGLELYELVETRLSERGEAEKIDALRKMREREGYLQEPVAEDFSNQETYWNDDPVNDDSFDEEPSFGADEPDERKEQTERMQRSTTGNFSSDIDEMASGASGEDEEWSEFHDPFEERSASEGDGFRRTTATTGVYSSLNAISEEHAREELREYYVRRRKIQIIIGLVIVALVAAALIFAFPADDSAETQDAPPSVETALE